MRQKSEVISVSGYSSLQREPGAVHAISSINPQNSIEIALLLALILAAVWTPRGQANSFFCIAAAACVVGFGAGGNRSASDLGLTRPLVGVGYIFATGVFLCGAIAAIGIPFRFAGPGYVLPWRPASLYIVWSLAQEFILQAVFYVRLESLLGSRRAVLAAASVFAVVHIPSPLLTGLSFFGGILFCELFRRWRNIYPLGIIHGALGLTIAFSLPDHWLHHMRVGIGYLKFH